MKTINLDDLEKQAHTVTRNGVSHRVRPVTARITTIIDAAQHETEGLAKMTLYYDAVSLLVPSMPRDEVNDLSLAQLNAIIQLANTQVDAVNGAATPDPGPSGGESTEGHAAPKAASPAPETSAAPGVPAVTS